MVAGAIGGTVSGIVLLPLELLKTRRQSAAWRSSGVGQVSLLAQARAVVASDGVLGLWRGLLPTLAGVAPTRAMHFALYNYYKRTFVEQFGMTKLATTTHLAAAAAASMSTSTLTCPLWTLKTRMQLAQTSSSAAHGLAGSRGLAVHTAGSMWQEGKLRPFFAGLSASYIGAFETAIQFALFEYGKRLYWERQHAQHGSSSGSTTGHSSAPQGSLSTAAGFWLGCTAKLTAAVTLYPHEVLRTRLREAGAGNLRTVAKQMWREGATAWYAGMGTHLARTVPNAGIMFAVVELLTHGTL